MPVEITEKWLLEVGGWKVMKEARSAYNAGAVSESSYDGKLLRGTIQSSGKPLVTGLVIHSRSDVENYCKCYDSRRFGTLCMHAIAVGLFQALGEKVEQKASGFPRRSGNTDSKPATTPSAPAQAIRVELSPNWLDALRKGRLAAQIALSTADRQPDAADRQLGDWLRKSGLTRIPCPLSLPLDLVPKFLKAAGSHKEVVLADGGSLGIASLPARLPATVEKTDETFTFGLDLGEATEVFTLGEEKQSRWLLSGDVMRLLPAPTFQGDADIMRDLLDGWQCERDLPWTIIHLASLQDAFLFPAGSALQELRLAPGIPAFTLSLEGSLRHLDAQLRARYGDIDVRVGEASPDNAFPAEFPAGSGKFLTRNLPAEKAALGRLETEFGFEPSAKTGGLVLKKEPFVLRFLSKATRVLKPLWTLEWGERINIIRSRFSLVSVQAETQSSPDAGWFGFSVSHVAGDGTRIPAADIARLLRTGQPKLDLPGGRTALIDLDGVEELERTLAEAGIKQSADGTARAKSVEAGFLADSIASLGGQIVDFPKVFTEPDETALSTQLPNLAKLLRDYQNEGVRWLVGRLGAEGGGGAILADEMGLGKTVQTLAALLYLSKTASPEHPALVVCPTSLLRNWEQEIQKFTPDLTVQVYHGPKRDAAKIDEHDITITTYGIVAREPDIIGARHWRAAILDEASLIRNPDAKTSKAVRALDAGARLALTGTPIENRPSDLWSIMGFALPGYLGDRKDFIERFEKPLSAGSGPERRQVAERFRRKIAPFVLRRLKSEVAKDLPQKIERVVPLDLFPRQQEAYRRILEEGLNKADDERKRGGANAARMCLLTTLLRLRQVCCDLRLVGFEDKEEALGSAKVQAFQDLVMEGFEGGHRILVFSQFAKMLHILRDNLKQGGMPFCYLDGSSQDRAEQVERFQKTPEIPVFLISLKAGGYGLNLTAADTVIHFDPWWNPAVEAQATDRAHRIGQDRPVSVHKLIATGTVEESILQLQRKKRDILDAALDDEAPLMQGLGDKELIEMLR